MHFEDTITIAATVPEGLHYERHLEAYPAWNTAGPEVDRSLRYPSNLYHTDLRLAARHQATRVFLEALLETNHVITGNAGVPIDPPCLFRTLFNYWLE